MNCLNCGASIEDGALFCGSCGAKVEQPQEEPVAEIYEEPAGANEEGPRYSAPPYEQPQPAGNINGTIYLVLSILATIFCCLPFGIPSIVYAARINNLQDRGDAAGAEEAAKKARLWIIVSAALGVLWVVVWLFMMMSLSFSALTGITSY